MKYQRENKLLIWIEGRLTNLKERGETVSTDDLIRDASGFFKINTHPFAVKKLKEKIKKIRRKIDTRHHRKFSRIKKLAKDIGVNPDLVERWVRAGWINISDYRQVKTLRWLIHERDYALSMKLEEISKDYTKNLWD